MTLKFSKHELEHVVGHPLGPSDRLSGGDYEKLEAVWRAGLRPDTPWRARVRAWRRSVYPEEVRDPIRRVLMTRFRVREGLNPDGSQDPVCNILGPGAHRWESSLSNLRCTECGDIDFDWVPGWCPSGWCRCDPERRDTGKCPCVHPHPDLEVSEDECDPESEFDLDWGLPRASEYDRERCAPRCEEGKTSDTVWEEDSVWVGDVPTTLKGLRELGTTVGIKGSSKMDSKTLLGKLGIPQSKATLEKPRVSISIVLTDQESGEVLRFPSMSKTAKYLGANPGSVSYHIKGDGKITAGGRTYTVVKEVPDTESET